ncbi:hypothetical protein D3C85_1370030 [compost metagenome]
MSQQSLFRLVQRSATINRAHPRNHVSHIDTCACYRRQVSGVRIALAFFITALGIAVDPAKLGEIILTQAQTGTLLAQSLSALCRFRCSICTNFQSKPLYTNIFLGIIGIRTTQTALPSTMLPLFTLGKAKQST